MDFCFFILRPLLRQQDTQGKPLVLPMQGQRAAVRLGCRTDTFQVIAAVGAAAGQAVRAPFVSFFSV